MKNTVLSAFFAAVLMLLAGQADAGLLKLHAASAQANNPSTTISDFEVIFDDNGDGLFELAELVSFSGITVTPWIGRIPTTYTEITYVPFNAGYTIASNNSAALNWNFSTGIVGQPSSSINNAVFTFSITPIDVPVAGMMPLLLIGAGLIAAKNRRA